MSGDPLDSYLGEIRLFAGTYAPEGWLQCNGAVLNVSEYPALYSLIGNIYGGSAPSTFAVPDLRGRVPVHYGTGGAVGTNPPLTNRPLGQMGGTETVTLVSANLPAHNHVISAVTNANPGGATQTPSTSKLVASGGNFFAPAITTQVSMDPNFLGNATGYNSQPHENRMPSQALTYIISINGIYPQHP